MTNQPYKSISEYNNILITDDKGHVIFFDAVDLNVLKDLGIHPDEFIGKKITSAYKNLTDENSTIMQVLRTGVPILNNTQMLIAVSGKVRAINSTYPLMEGSRIVGAVEFSSYFFGAEKSYLQDSYSPHKIYRKNNTIYTIDDFITINPGLLDIKSRLPRIAKSDSTILIYGKTGTGKEVLAQSIHNLSDRYNRPFLSINCGAIPVNLLESMLFGTTKGSFTGACDVPGLFEQADGGSVFLDEINSLEISLQAKLLKAIEEKSIRRIGATKSLPLNIRLISAANEPLEEIVKSKRLREDLFYRLNVVQINLPELKEHKEDIDGLVQYYLNRFNSMMDFKIQSVQDDVMAAFRNYDWPGNVRELKNAIETAFNLAQSSNMTLSDIPDRIRNYSKKEETTVIVDSDTGLDLKTAVDRFEAELIQAQFSTNNYLLSETARKLGLSKQLLKYKIEKYHILKP